MIDQHVPPGQAADIFVAYGETARELVSLQSARGINLTVIGRRDASLMRDVLQRSKGQRVLNQSAGDVLVSALHHAATYGDRTYASFVDEFHGRAAGFDIART